MYCKEKQEFSIVFTVSCPSLILENGEVSYNTPSLYDDHFVRTGYSVGTMASFSCDKFYSLEGFSSVICQSSGYWSQSAPICNASNKNKLIFYFEKLFFDWMQFYTVCDNISSISGITSFKKNTRQSNQNLSTLIFCMVSEYNP